MALTSDSLRTKIEVSAHSWTHSYTQSCFKLRLPWKLTYRDSQFRPFPPHLGPSHGRSCLLNTQNVKSERKSRRKWAWTWRRRKETAWPASSHFSAPTALRKTRSWHRQAPRTLLCTGAELTLSLHTTWTAGPGPSSGSCRGRQCIQLLSLGLGEERAWEQGPPMYGVPRGWSLTRRGMVRWVCVFVYLSSLWSSETSCEPHVRGRNGRFPHLPWERKELIFREVKWFAQSHPARK